jgi:hypothetical protein
MVRRTAPDLGEWWPDLLSEIPSENPQAGKYLTVAEVLDPWGKGGHRSMYTALIPPNMIKRVLNFPGGIGVEIERNSPDVDRPLVPSFSIWGGNLTPKGFEPLVYAWESNLRLTLCPQAGFLMTYGLIPRWGRSEKEEIIYWDDVARPCNDVVIAKPVTQYQFSEPCNARIEIQKDYLEDYATRRNVYMVQVLFAQRYGPISEDTKQILDTHGEFYKKFPGRSLQIRRISFKDYDLIAKVWLVRQIITPGRKPIHESRWDYGELIWPGCKEIVSANYDWSRLPDEVYIMDTVLAKYEGHDEFEIIPELGAVECGGQWAVGYCRRLGRDLIEVELRKLYEGVPSEVVKHWHKYAVEIKNPHELMGQANIASRTKRIIYSYCYLGEALSYLFYKLTGRLCSCKDLIKLDLQELKYHGWWKDVDAEKASHHAPANMTMESFLQRAGILYKLVVERLSERFLRDILLSMGSSDTELKDSKSIKLLCRIEELCKVAESSGLKFLTSNNEINARRKSNTIESDLAILEVLNSFRLLEAHRSNESKSKIKSLLGKLNISARLVDSGWGIVLDKLYDSIAKALEKTAELIRTIVSENISS